MPRPITQARRGFDQGHAAFSRVFPGLAAKIGLSPFYVCPLCLFAYGETALYDGLLTREDVPPRSVGGRKIVLTCKPCNDRAGHQIDWHALREADLIGFLTRGNADMRANLRTASGHVPIRLRQTNARASSWPSAPPSASSRTSTPGSCRSSRTLVSRRRQLVLLQGISQRRSRRPSSSIASRSPRAPGTAICAGSTRTGK
jgi:hypothetical protein